MYYNFPQNRKYMISRDLVVKLDSKIIETNGVDIDIEIYGVLRTVELKWLYGISLYGIVMPKGYEDNIFDIIFKPTSIIISTIKDNIIPVFKSPILIKSQFRMLAQYPNYAIDINSKLLNIKTGKIYNIVKGTLYPRLIIVTSNTRVYIGAHRLLALAWLYNDDYINKPIINHKDGDKFNLTIDNLEWSSYSNNVNHAIITGLATQQHKFKMLDTLYNKIYTLHSARDLSRVIGIKTISYLSQYVLRYSQYVLFNRYIVKSIDNLDDWVDLNTLTTRNSEINPTSNIIEAKSIKTGKVISMTVNSMAKFLGVSEEYLRIIALKYKQHGDYGYIVRYKDSNSWDSIELIENKIKAKGILALSKNNQMVFNSLREASRYFKCDKKTIALKLDTDKEYNNYKFKLIKHKNTDV